MLSEGLLGKTPSQTAGPHARGTVAGSGEPGVKNDPAEAVLFRELNQRVSSPQHSASG